MTDPIDISLSFLPFEQVIKRALGTQAASGLYTGFGIIGLGFLLSVVREIWRDVQGQKVNYSQHILSLITLVAFLSVYRPFVLKTVQILSQLGESFLGMERLDVAYLQRVNAFLNYDAVASHSGEASAISIGTRPALVDALSFFCAQTACFVALYMASFLKSIQIFMLSAVISSGPVILGLSMLGQFFRPLAAAWLATLIEVSFWSFAMDILNYTLAPVSSIPPAHFSTIHELMLALTLIVVMATIPTLSRRILRFELNPKSLLAAGVSGAPSTVSNRFGHPLSSAGAGAPPSPKSEIYVGLER